MSVRPIYQSARERSSLLGELSPTELELCKGDTAVAEALVADRLPAGLLLSGWRHLYVGAVRRVHPHQRGMLGVSVF